MEKQNIKGLDLAELQELTDKLGEKKYRSSQLFNWLYAKYASSISEMTDLSKVFRDILNKKTYIYNLKLINEKIASDGTVKYLYELEDKLAIECVIIPSSNNLETNKRTTLCISTQVGCPLECSFCATGKMGFKRNLTAGEIIDQVIQSQKKYDKRITNIVYMGMGEPMLNYNNVIKSINIINHDKGLNIGTRHITISTAGYADKIIQMADDKCKAKLAVSLHSLNNHKRTEIMPITKKYSVDELINAVEYHYHKTKTRPTFEYILFEGFNDTNADIEAFKKLSRKIPCKVNLIPYHPIDFINSNKPKIDLKPSNDYKINAFADALRKLDITVMVRKSSGKDINAACGQLAITNHQ